MAKEQNKKNSENIVARARFVRTPPDKIRSLSSVILGKEISKAIDILNFIERAAAKPLILVLKSAQARGKDAGRENLIIKTVIVDEGPKLKRRRIIHRGRATAILKRRSHITVVLTNDGNSKFEIRKLSDQRERQMGHKVNPKSFRLQINKDWQSKWFAERDFSKYLGLDIEIRQALSLRLGKNSGIAKVEIGRWQDTFKISIHTSKPGVLIGRSGQGINDIRDYLVQNCNTLRDPKTGKLTFKLEIEIIEVKTPDLSAQIVAENIAYQIEKRIAFKRAIKQAIGKVMDARAKGVRIAVAGRLGGAEIARREHYGAGSVPLGRLRADIDFAHVDALTTYGIIGVKVWIYKGDKITES